MSCFQSDPRYAEEGVARSWPCTPVGGGDEGRPEGRLAA